MISCVKAAQVCSEPESCASIQIEGCQVVSDDSFLKLYAEVQIIYVEIWVEIIKKT